MQRPDEAKEPAEDSEPTHTGTRSVHGLRAAHLEKLDQSQARESARVTARPSAFGVPPSSIRQKLPPREQGEKVSPALANEERARQNFVIKAPASDVRELAPAQQASAPPLNRAAHHAVSADSAPSSRARGELPPSYARIEGAQQRARADVAPSTNESPVIPRALGAALPTRTAGEGSHAPPAVKTDIEQLLPISHVAKSLPEPPRLPQFEPPRTAPRRYPWISLATFALMVTASALTLSRYSGSREERAPAARVVSLGAASATNGEAARPEVARSNELTELEAAVREESERAAERGDNERARAWRAELGEASRGDGRLELELSRARADAGDLPAAERWIRAAIRKNSQNREYHAFYGELLARAGRAREAERERSRAAD